MIVAHRFLVQGRVQGVGFRFFTEDAARRENLAGFVRNLADGRVEVVAEGERDALRRFELALHAGPPLARVERVAVEKLAPAGRTPVFRIR